MKDSIEPGSQIDALHSSSTLYCSCEGVRLVSHGWVCCCCVCRYMWTDKYLILKRHTHKEFLDTHKKLKIIFFTKVEINFGTTRDHTNFTRDHIHTPNVVSEMGIITPLPLLYGQNEVHRKRGKKEVQVHMYISMATRKTFHQI
jgi:hypothetical protein